MSQLCHAFLTLLSHAANEGIRTGRFDPAAPNCKPMERRTSVRFDAPLGSIPVRVSMGDWRFDEACIAVAAWPTPDVDQWIEAITAKDLAGDVTAIGYLERKKDGSLMLANPFEPLMFIRQNRRASLLSMPIPSDAADPLQLYRRYFNFAAA